MAVPNAGHPYSVVPGKMIGNPPTPALPAKLGTKGINKSMIE
jgi:hypothetical protein